MGVRIECDDCGRLLAYDSQPLLDTSDRSGDVDVPIKITVSVEHVYYLRALSGRTTGDARVLCVKCRRERRAEEDAAIAKARVEAIARRGE